MSENRQYYYVSLAYYGHLVYRCAGHGAESPDHRSFYVPYFEQNGAHNEGADKGPYKVFIVDEPLGDNLVTEDRQPISVYDAIQKYGKLP